MTKPINSFEKTHSTTVGGDPRGKTAFYLDIYVYNYFTYSMNVETNHMLTFTMF